MLASDEDPLWFGSCNMHRHGLQLQNRDLLIQGGERWGRGLVQLESIHLGGKTKFPSQILQCGLWYIEDYNNAGLPVDKPSLCGMCNPSQAGTAVSLFVCDGGGEGIY